MQRYRDVIKGKEDRIMELESVNGLLEKSLSNTNAQLFETRREAVVSSVEESADLEEFFTRKLEEMHSLTGVMRARIAELEESLYLKEQESGARQMQINHLLSLSNQLEHAAEVNTMRNKLREADKRIQELLMQRFNNTAEPVAGVQQQQQQSPVCSSAAAPRMAASRRVNLLGQDQTLASRFRDFFRRLDTEGPLCVDHLEEHMYDQFLLDQPNQEQNKLRPDMYLRDEMVQAMHRVGGVGDFNHRKQSLSLRHGDGVRVSKRNFAACLASMGGKFKRRRGARYWLNVGMARRPLFAWDV
jgi:chorismate mutase